MLFFTGFFTISVVKKNVTLKRALAIFTGAPITVPNDTIEILTFVADKITKDSIKLSKEEIYLLSLLLVNSLSLLSAIK